jgi:hypothetical protein
VKFAPAHGEQRRIHETEDRDAQREPRAGARLDQREEQRRDGGGGGGLNELQRQRGMGQRHEGPQQDQRRRPMVTVVRAVLDAVVHPAERVEYDLYERAGVGAVRPARSAQAIQPGEQHEHRGGPNPDGRDAPRRA